MAATATALQRYTRVTPAPLQRYLSVAPALHISKAGLRGRRQEGQ